MWQYKKTALGSGRVPDLLRKFVYVSRSKLTPETENEELAVIRAVSASNNTQWGLTGSLIHAPGFFAQYLEGPEAALDELIQRLRKEEKKADTRISAFSKGIEQAESSETGPSHGPAPPAS